MQKQRMLARLLVKAGGRFGPTLLLALGLMAAIRPVPAAAAVAATDDQGRRVELASPARRVVSLAPNVTEMLFALGAGAQVVGVTEQCDYPASARSLPKVGSYSSANAEAVVEQHPDLVVASFGNSLDTLATLRRLGLTVFVTNPTDVRGVFRDMAALGTLVGRRAEGQRAVAGLQKRLRRTQQRVAGQPRPRTLVLVWDDPATVAGGPSFVTDILRDAGGVNAAAGIREAYPKIDSERMLTLNPGVILFPGGEHGDRIAKLKTRPGFQGTEAVRNGRVHAIDENLLFRAGPRVVDAVEMVARLLHPEAFAGKERK